MGRSKTSVSKDRAMFNFSDLNFSEFNFSGLIALIIFITLIFILILVLFTAIKTLKSEIRLIQTNISSNELLVSQLQNLLIKTDKTLKNYISENHIDNVELNQVSKQLEHRIKCIQDDIQMLQQVQSQQPEDKLYSRAFKMVELGADAKELTKECDIPKAEAEMLIAIHQKKTSS